MSESHWPDFNEQGDKETESQKANRSAFSRTQISANIVTGIDDAKKKKKSIRAIRQEKSPSLMLDLQPFFILSSFLDIWFVVRSQRFRRFHRDDGLYENAQTVVNFMILQIYE